MNGETATLNDWEYTIKVRMEERLFELAEKALENSYSRWSGISVGAALLTDKDEIFTGVNVENISFGLTICAERSAIFTAVGRGMKTIKMIAVTSDKVKDITPCGACRQVILEFATNETKIIVGDNSDGKKYKVFALKELLPESPDIAGVLRNH